VYVHSEGNTHTHNYTNSELMKMVMIS
jgi:hypothetical protein